MDTIKWHTEKRKIKDLIPDPANPRVMSERQVKDLTESLRKFDLAEIPAINLDNMILAGHQRLKILSIMGRGEEEIDVRVPNRKLTEDEAREYNLRSNKNTGSWDWDMLANVSEDLLKEVGFASEELDRIFKGAAEDEAPETDDSNVVSKYGEIYQMGKHRIMCGDATKLEDIKKLLDGKRARLIFTDPPYNVDYESQSGNTYHGKGKIFNDNKSDSDALAFYSDVLKNLYQVSTEDCTLYWWFANRNNLINRQAWIDSGWNMSQIIIWLKNKFVFSLGQDYHRVYEPCMVGWKSKGKHYTNKLLGTLEDAFNLDKDEFEEILDVWYSKRDDVTKYVHPTQKPVRLAERAIKKNSQGGGSYFRCFRWIGIYFNCGRADGTRLLCDGTGPCLLRCN